MKKKYLAVGLILLGLAVIGGGVLWRSMKSVEPSVTEPSEEAKETRPEEAEPTEEAVEPEIKQEASPEAQKTDEELIAEAFAEKYNKSIEDVNITINQKAEPFAQGGVSFAGEISGAMWLAYKEGDDWLIVFDGQGTIPCSAVNPYNFPAEMAPECWDEANGKLIQRG